MKKPIQLIKTRGEQNLLTLALVKRALHHGESVVEILPRLCRRAFATADAGTIKVRKTDGPYDGLGYTVSATFGEVEYRFGYRHEHKKIYIEEVGVGILTWFDNKSSFQEIDAMFTFIRHGVDVPHVNWRKTAA